MSSSEVVAEGSTNGVNGKCLNKNTTDKQLGDLVECKQGGSSCLETVDRIVADCQRNGGHFQGGGGVYESL